MASLHVIPADTRPAWFPMAMRLSACIALGLLMAAWWCGVTGRSITVQDFLTGVAAILAGAACALDVRPPTGRLHRFGKDNVQVRSLDDWTMYQYNLRFDEASPEQQSEALSHYGVGLRLFPARLQDRTQKRGSWQWLLSFVVFCSVVTLSEEVRGWHRLLLVAAYFAWLWVCLRLSRRLSDEAATSGLTGLDLS